MVQYRAFRQQLIKEGCRPAYLLIGEEEFLQDRACLEIARAFLGNEFTQEGVRTIYATDVDGPGIVEQCLNLGLFQQKQVLVVKEADALSSKGRKAVLGYLAKPSPDTCLVLISRKLEEKSPLVKDAGELVLTIMFQPPGEEELARWLVSSARDRGWEMDREAAEALISVAGTSMGVLDRELDKISQFLGGEPGRRIDKSVVRGLAGLSAQASPDDLNQAVSQNDRKTSLSLLQQLLDSGEDPVRMTSGIFYQMEHLWKVKLAAETKRPQGTIERKTFWGLNKQPIVTAAPKRNDRQYLKAMKVLFTTEYLMKSGGGDPKILALQAVHQLTAK
jgi:DNA polymerase-3 subunit delta